MEDAKAAKLADMSMLAMARILGEIHRSPILAAYRSHPGLQNRLEKTRCRVNLTSGLHTGWAIEGAVGTEFKIDTRYLSPHVTTADGMGRLCKIYGVSIAISERVVTLCSPGMADRCRMIDTVKLPGWHVPAAVYSLDLDHLAMEVDTRESTVRWGVKTRFKARQFLESEKGSKWNDDVSITGIFRHDPTLVAMRELYTGRQGVEFKQLFKMGLLNYHEGEWPVAEKFLRKTSQMLGVEDGPSLSILKYMERQGQEPTKLKFQSKRLVGAMMTAAFKLSLLAEIQNHLHSDVQASDIHVRDVVGFGVFAEISGPLVSAIELEEQLGGKTIEVMGHVGELGKRHTAEIPKAPSWWNGGREVSSRELEKAEH